MKAPHEEGSGGCKVIRKGPSPEGQFEVDFAEWETVSEGRKGGSSCGRNSASTARRRERAVRAEAGWPGVWTRVRVRVRVRMCAAAGSIFRGVRSVCGGLGIHLTLLGRQETFPSWEDQKVSLFSAELNPEELR